MNKLLVGSLFFCTGIMAAEQVVLEAVHAQTNEKMPVYIAIVGKRQGRVMQDIAALIQHDLSFTDQLQVTVATMDTLSSKEQIKQLRQQGYHCACFLGPDDSKSIEWRVYDTVDATMLKGQKMAKRGLFWRGWAHNCADEIWQTLMGTPGFFSTKIVYGKQVCRRGRNCKRHLFIRDCTDTTGATEQLLVAVPTVSVCPRWNNDPANPLVIYSEHRPTNVCLMAADMHGKRSVISNFDGINMQVAYAPQGDAVVYCLSHPPAPSFPMHSSGQLYHYTFDAKLNRPVYRRLTFNTGNNFAPCWGPGNSIFYASDFTKNGMPNICWLDLESRTVTWLTKGAYATCPSYAPLTNDVIFTKMVQRKMQLCAYNLTTKQERQLTIDATDKDDCTVSSCGRAVVYSVERDGKGRLAFLYVPTGKQIFLTSAHDDCSYPAWSPRYENIPVVTPV